MAIMVGFGPADSGSTPGETTSYDDIGVTVAHSHRNSSWVSVEFHARRS